MDIHGFQKRGKKFKRSAKKFWNKARPYAGIIVGAVISLYCTVCGSAITKAAIAGAAAGAVSAAANGGNILRGAVTGAFSGAVFGAIGASGLGDSARILAHGVAGGVMSVIQGGKFGTGFMSAGFTKFVTLRFSQANVLGMGSTNQSFGRVAGRTAVAAVVGGTASKIGGGKFANGAKTAAMAHLFNAEGQLARLNDANGPSIWGFIKEEGVNVLLRTGQAVGGGGQVLLGGAICYGSGGLACAAGAVIIAKGADNFQAGIRGTDSASQQLLVYATGSEQAGTIINASLDLGTSIVGLVRSVPKISSYGTAYNSGWYKGVPGYYEPAVNQATKIPLAIEAFSSGSTIYGVSQ